MNLQQKQNFRFSRDFCSILLCLGIVYSTSLTAYSDDTETPSSPNSALIKRRLEVLAAGQQGVAALPLLQDALKNDNALIRRAAVFSLNEIGMPAWATLQTALNDQDMLVRRSALRDLSELDQQKSIPLLSHALSDPEELIQVESLKKLIDIKPRTSEITELLKKTTRDPNPLISDLAAKALWPFKKIGLPLQDKLEFSTQQLVVTQNVALPEDNWRFRTDPNETGLDFKWYSADYLGDKFWPTISVTNNWERQIEDDKDYDGIAWYRQIFLLPEKPTQVGTNIVFSGVGESAWVWINGTFIGGHDIWPKGKNQSFSMDVGPSLKWNQLNQITVRIKNRSGDGGIWMPVYLEILNGSKGGK